VDLQATLLGIALTGGVGASSPSVGSVTLRDLFTTGDETPSLLAGPTMVFFADRTGGVMVREVGASALESAAAVVQALAVLPVNEEADALIDELFAERLPESPPSVLL